MKTIYSEQFWRSLLYFNLYRLLIACGIVFATELHQLSNFGVYNASLFHYATHNYVLICFLSILPVELRRPNFKWQLSFQVISDIIFIIVMIYASGGIQNGLGILLLVSLACAGLISQGKLALFYAAVASIGVLLQETYAVLHIDNYSAQFTHAGLLSMGYFAVAWLTQRLAVRAIASEQLALQREVDVANWTQINQLVIQDMQDGVLVVDSTGEIRQRNFCAEKLIGLGPGSAIPDHPKLADYVPALASRLANWRGDVNTNPDLLRLPASNILVRTRFVPIKQNSHADVVIFLEDMSRTQAQAQQLKLAALGRLTANIAHEIRNPLSAISHAAELLGEEHILNPTHSRLLCIIHDNTQRLNKIVQDVLQLNRRDIVGEEAINAGNFIRAFIENFCHTEKINLDIYALDIAEQKTIIFDQVHLNQILWNLCRNAWRHSHKKRGSILLRLTDGTDAACINIDVIDDGPGVAPIQLKQLFEPFFTTAASGTGLGLYIAREMCETNHASLNYIENTKSGHFRIICKKKLTHAKSDSTHTNPP